MCSRNFNAPGSPFYGAGGGGAATTSSNKYRSEDIMSCISALDEVIAEFDDPSLPYIYEDEGSIQATTVQTGATTGNPSQIVPSSSGETSKYFSSEDKLVLKNEKANHATPHKVQPGSESNIKSSPPSHRSHLIQIPVYSSKSSSSIKFINPEGAGVIQVQPISKEKVISPSSSSTSTPSSLSSKLPGRPSVVPRTSSDSSSKVSKSGSSANVVGGACGGTYSKGTSSQEILLLPRIPSSSDKSSVGSSSSRKNVQQEPIYSSVGKSRPQLSLGMYTSEPIHRHLDPPQEPEVDYNDHDGMTHTGDATSSYNANNHNEHRERISIPSSSGRQLKSSPSGASSISDTSTSHPTIEPTKELWNFPSDKNLPRSLRKTRNTCFLDENSEGEKSEGKLNNESDSEGHSIGGHSSSSHELYPTRHPHNGRNSKVDDNRKIYEEIVVISPSSKEGGSAKSNNLQQDRRENKSASSDSFGRASSSSSNSFTFNSFNNNSTSPESTSKDPPFPKPRARQQIPQVDEVSPVKYPPPGKIPKPNPKPVTGTNQIEPSSPFSPLQCEINRTGDEGVQEIVNVSKILNETTNEIRHSMNNNRMKNLNNGNSSNTTTPNPTTPTNNGHMMRMMMMNGTPSSKNNSTGSASSISRSSSSSSGGDPNYYRKDNLSSSSGVVVTTNSSITTGSPTHSVNNNSFALNNNNNITIIHSENGGGTDSSVMEVKGHQKQRVTGQRGGHSIGKQPSLGGSAFPVHHSSSTHAKPISTVVLTNNGVLEVDDGYLSMINRNEAPLLWPEEFIENETFSPDELKRLSVHLPEEDEDDTSSRESDSCSEGKEIELEIVDYDREPSRRQPNHNRSLKSSGVGCEPMKRRQLTEKTEYFSDDSLEGDREEELTNFRKKTRGGTCSASPYRYPSSDGPRHNVNELLSTNSSPSRPYYRQQITVNTALVTPVKGQVSRIPKMISGSRQRKGGKSSVGDVQEKVPKRKPCSFFVSLTDEGRSTGEVNSTNNQTKSSSLPIGIKVAASPTTSSVEASTSIDASRPTNLNVESKSTTVNIPGGGTSTNNTSTAPTKHSVGSNLLQPQLRHTKSINTGGPRHSSNVNNANKRKSTSDLVTVVALKHNDTDMQQDQHKNPTTTTGSVNTSMFNRTSTFLIPSPISRTGHDELNTTQSKRPKDDETDNDEDDFSSDFDILSSADPEPDSLQPLSLTEVNDFVSEIMDTALRQEIKRTQMVLNNYPTDMDCTNPKLIDDDKADQEQPLELQNGKKSSNLSLPQEKKKFPKVSEAAFGCDNDDQARENLVDGEERARVALQLEAVVSTFLSDNQRFLIRGESQDGDLDEEMRGGGGGGSNECDKYISSQLINASPEEKEMNFPMVLKHGESLEEPRDEKEKVVQDEINLPHDNADSNLLSESAQPPPTSSSPINPISKPSGSFSNNSTLRDSSLVGEEKILDVEESDDDDDSEEQPPEFIPTPPPHMLSPPPLPVAPIIPTISQKNFQSGFIHTNGNLHNLHNSNVRDGKAALDILAERINNSKKFSSQDDQLQVSQFIHDKRNIWAMYDRPFDEDLLTVNNPGARGYASRSQENLVDAMTKERFQKSFTSRGQSSTLPLNCRPPSAGQRRSSTFRNMFSKFRKSKPSGPAVIKELPEYRDDEVQSITSRETGPSEQGKKRGFFSRLFRRSRKN